MGNVARTAGLLQLGREHDRAVACAGAGEKCPERRGDGAAGTEDPVVDFPQVAGAADDETATLVARVACRVGKGFVLGGERRVGVVHSGELGSVVRDVLVDEGLHEPIAVIVSVLDTECEVLPGTGGGVAQRLAA